MTDPHDPESPAPRDSQWSGIHREGSPTGMPRFPWSGITRTVTGRRLLIQVGLVFGATLAGYLVAAIWLFPAPLFSEAVAVPRVLELDVATATQRLTDAGLHVRRADDMPHPSAVRGSVVWQEPAPYSEVGPGATVDLVASSGPPEIAIPDVEGFDATLALKVLSAAGIQVSGTDSVSNAAPKGTALATRPAAGTTRGPADSVQLVVSSGPATAPIPDVAGLDLRDARDKLFNAGFTVGKITKERSEGVADGLVIRQHPIAGGLASRDGKVDLVIAGEPE